jgi:Tol biopolymer transport system component
MKLYRLAIFGVAVLVVLSVVGIALSLTPTSTTVPTPPSVAIIRLTESAGHDLHPAWSPDGQLIAFESNRDGQFHIYLMYADGRHQRALTSGANKDRHPVWTPDGQAILYDSDDGTHQDIWRVNIADGSRKQLTHVAGLADFATLSPDGQQLVFYCYKNMTLNLWTAHADGSDAKALTHDLADALKEQPTIAVRQPSWSADSQWLAYTGGNGKSIWLMRRDGSQAHVIIDDGETNRFPWFLTDGRLAYITEYVRRYEGAWTNVWVYDLQTQQRTLLREHMSMQEPVAWNADQSKLLFSSPRNGGRFNIYLIDLNAPDGLAELQGTAVPVR